MENTPRTDDAWELFFKWEHLTNTKLQNASKPCCMIGQKLARGEEIPEKTFTDLIIWARQSLPKNRQQARCVAKLEEADEAFAMARGLPFNVSVLDLLLEAKDCAVRSVLADN